MERGEVGEVQKSEMKSRNDRGDGRGATHSPSTYPSSTAAAATFTADFAGSGDVPQDQYAYDCFGWAFELVRAKIDGVRECFDIIRKGVNVENLLSARLRAGRCVSAVGGRRKSP